MKTALITGITGQDGSYLAEFLLAKGYRVVGMVRRTSTIDYSRIEHIQDQIELAHGDLLDQGSLYAIFDAYRPDEVYNLGGQSNVQLSWSQAVLTAESTALGVTRLLDCMRQVTPASRFYQASTSEIFGDADESPQTLTTHLNPRNPYGVAKVYGHLITQNYRQRQGLFAVSGVLYNHESPRRGLDFVTRKITHGVAQIKLGLATELRLGNLDAQRDWGFAGDYVQAMADAPTRSTGGLRGWHRSTAYRAGFLSNRVLRLLTWITATMLLKILLSSVRQNASLLADPSQTIADLGWLPQVDFEGLIEMMVTADLAALGA